MSLIEEMKLESWKYIYEQNSKKSTDYNCIVVMSEYTGGSIDFNHKKISERSDFIILIPMIIININSVENVNILSEIIKSDFRKYEFNKLPTTFHVSENVKAELIGNKLYLSFRNKDIHLNKKIDVTDKEKNILKSVKNFSLVINDDTDSYIIRVSLCKNIEDPFFPIKRISLKQKNIDKILDAIIENINKLEEAFPYNMNMYLDYNGSSDYEVYQSTENIESLPSIGNLSFGGICYSCGEHSVTREHCSPKWMTDKYKVKPLIGKILCTNCNSWFGKNYESQAYEKLQIKNNHMTEEQRIFISKWCIKTAFTMSLASGVSINPNYLFMLRNNEFPKDIEVYFDPRYKLYEQGFNYGVSRFNYELSTKSTFLFTFICTDFVIVVMKTENKDIYKIPFYRIYPEFLEGQKDNTFSNLPDFHQNIHELISKEKTIDFTLPKRIQSRKT